MAITKTDVSINSSGDIRWTGVGAGDGPYTVLELHRFLQDLADDAQATDDDLVDITSVTPSERSTDNIITLLGTYNIDDTMATHLYDGSILQKSGDELYSGLVVVGALNSTTTLKIVQNNLFYDDQSTPFWGTGLNADAGNNILMRCLVKTRTAAADIDGRRVRVHARTFGDTYSEFSSTLGLGNSVAAIFTNEDLNNATIAGTVATWSGITNTEGYQTINLNNGNGLRPYFSQWDRDIYTINDLYERAKWLQRSSSASTIYGMNGELFRGITHQWDYDNESAGSFVQNEVISWGTGATAGTGALLAFRDDGTTGEVWIQLLTGVPPSDNLSFAGASCSADVNGNVTARSISPAFIGQSTGSAIIGAFGIGIESADLTVNDKLFDLTNTLQQPPNNVNFSVTGLVSSEDRVLVGTKDTGDSFKLDQLTLNTTLSGAAVTSVVVTTAIPSDTPSTGTIRIQLNSGKYRRVEYTSWTGSTFTIVSTDFSTDNATAPKNVWISYIDKLATSSGESFTVVYSADRALYVRVRDGGGTPIKTFETPANLGAAGGSVAAIRTSDL